MADTITPKLGLTKPEIGASHDTWGNKLNTNFDILDLKTIRSTAQWSMTLGDDDPVSVAGHFVITRFGNNTLKIDDPLIINRQTGEIIIANKLTVNGEITSTAGTGSVFTNGVVSKGDIVATRETAGQPTHGALFFGNSSTKYILYDGTNININGAPVAVSDALTVTGAANLAAVNASGVITAANELKLKQGAVGTIRFGVDDATYLHYNGTKLSVSKRLGVPAPTEGDDATNYNHVESRASAHAAAAAAPKVNRAGDTMTGKLTAAASPSHIAYDTGGAGLQVYGSSANNHAYMEFHKPGFACNFGIAEDQNFYYGGWSFGPGAWFRFWTTRDFAALPNVSNAVTNARWTHIGDVYHASYTGMTEPHGGTAVTGASGIDGAIGFYHRHRALQLLTTSWWTVGYA